jgi:REP element-mobilizing transposase RayT
VWRCASHRTPRIRATDIPDIDFETRCASGRDRPKCALLRRKLQLISPHVLTCDAVAACSNASTRFSRHVFRDREHSPSSASLQGQRAVGRPASWRAQSRCKLWLATRGMGVFSNHYHFVAQSPEREDNAKSLGRMLSLFHEKTAKWVNRLDHAQGRQVWFNFRETTLTYEKSYLARLNYTHQNAVKHGLVSVANQYPWVRRDGSRGPRGPLK